jgi:hypothetical protein
MFWRILGITTLIVFVGGLMLFWPALVFVVIPVGTLLAAKLQPETDNIPPQPELNK